MALGSAASLVPELLEPHLHGRSPMERRTPIWLQRQVWTSVVALAALAFWVVGVGAGWRGWVLTPSGRGIVGHAQGFGAEAYIWWVPATVLTLTTVLMTIGISVVRHLVDALKAETAPKAEPLTEQAPLTEEEPLTEQAPLTEEEPLTEQAPLTEEEPARSANSAPQYDSDAPQPAEGDDQVSPEAGGSSLADE